MKRPSDILVMVRFLIKVYKRINIRIMKSVVYISLAFVVSLSSCYSSRSLSNSIEDDIYYVPGSKPLIVKEVEAETGQQIQMSRPAEETASHPGIPTPAPTTTTINGQRGTTEQISTPTLASRAEAALAATGTTREVIYENTGYWVGGFKGSKSDLQEAARIIAQYPEGFGYIANGQEIAMDLSFSPDWNVYTDNGRYWWFPSYTNIDLYSTFIFGTYPKYIWTVVWNQPGYDSFVFNDHFNWGVNFGWGGPGWRVGFGWNNGYYRPWYNGWYGWYDPWWNGYYPGWSYPHWHHPHWHYPNWGGSHFPGWTPPPANRPVRPNTGLRPGTGVRPGTTVRPGSNVRPGNTVTRPGNIRPGTSVRPGNANRPGMTRPNRGSTTRPGKTDNNIRPGTTTRPGSITRPSTTRPTITRPSTSGQNNRYIRPGNSNNRTGNTRTYNRKQSTSRPSYNNSRPTGSNYVPIRSGNVNRSSGSTRSTGRSGGRR